MVIHSKKSLFYAYFCDGKDILPQKRKKNEKNRDGRLDGGNGDNGGACPAD